MVTLIGMGLGTPETLTAQGLSALRKADFIAGAQRLLDSLPEGCTRNRGAATKPQALLGLIAGYSAPCVVYSGDTGFYSGARSLVPLLEEAGQQVEILPGVSSLQVLAARLHRPWQDWTLVSDHGSRCDPVSALLEGHSAFFLTGGAKGPGALCEKLAGAGLSGLPAVVGENLSYPNERLLRGTVGEFAGKDFAPLNVLLVDPPPLKREAVSQGIADGAFLRGQVPMTKQEVRAAALSKLGVRPNDVLWDVGAGTGSVAIEMALLARKGRVFAIERGEEACRLIEENRRRFGAYNLQVVRGTAPGALAGLPAPDAVFIGGSGGALGEIIAAVGEKAPGARVCVTAITVETLAQALRALSGLHMQTHVTQLSVSRSKRAGNSHMLLAENPVYLITGGCHE